MIYPAKHIPANFLKQFIKKWILRKTDKGILLNRKNYFFVVLLLKIQFPVPVLTLLLKFHPLGWKSQF